MKKLVSNSTFKNLRSWLLSLEGLMLKLKLKYFGHLMLKVDSLERTLMLGKIEDRRRRGLSGHEFEQTLELVMDREAWRAAVPGRPGVL